MTLRSSAAVLQARTLRIKSLNFIAILREEISRYYYQLVLA
jgi:hypothetical protein